jgi:hypothetical protein
LGLGTTKSISNYLHTALKVASSMWKKAPPCTSQVVTMFCQCPVYPSTCPLVKWYPALVKREVSMKPCQGFRANLAMCRASRVRVRRRLCPGQRLSNITHTSLLTILRPIHQTSFISQDYLMKHDEKGREPGRSFSHTRQVSLPLMAPRFNPLAPHLA